MEKIRIGMFSWESLYSIRVGGISPHVSELSEALAADGHEVHLFTRGHENNAAARVLRKRDARFVLIGEGEMRSHCESQVHKLGIRNLCNFLGYAPDNTVIDWFNACDLVCVPSRNERNYWKS